MKKYQSHKIVEAAVIVMPRPSTNHVEIEGGEAVRVPHDLFSRGMPAPGDYLVRYQPDGYLSWSPKAVFEAWYREVGGGDYRARVRQERADLDERFEKLEQFLATCGDQLDRRLLEAQAEAMQRYSEVLRLRVASFPDGPVLQSADLIAAGKAARGEPAAVEVTVTAPAGKRAAVLMSYAEVAETAWTVTGGKSQTWSLIGDETLTVHLDEDHSTVAHKRDAS